MPRGINRCLLWKFAALLAALTVIVGLVGVPSSVAAPPEGFQKSLVVGDGLNQPSGFEFAPDGRIFVLQRGGKVRIIKNGQLLAEPFADLPSENTGDRGLIGLAFDPDFGITNHYVYFYYTGLDLLNRLVRFNASEDVGTDGPLLLFQTQSQSQLLHVGGSIRFGPDGKLYFAVGDNGTPYKAQELDNPHGKILRINKDGSIPTDNPFYGQPGTLGAIWAYGFRNPWRFQFDSATGEMYGGDVGDFTWEELNHIVRGGNYGWPVKEGVCSADCAGYRDPIHAYNHDGESSAVTGGPVYRSGMFPPEYQGRFFFGDYARQFIKTAQLDSSGNVTSVSDFDTQAGSVVDMKIAPDGSMYYITYFPGAMYRVTYNTTSHLPVANSSADVTKGIEPLTVHFSTAGSSDPDGEPLSFLWDFGDGTTSTEENPTKTYPDKGVYPARLTVTAGDDHTSAQPIVVQVGIPPTLTVASPVDGQLYRAGDTITYNAFASDAGGFDLNDANIKAEVRLHHGTHYHPFVGPLTGRVGSFTIPATGESSADTSYELKVTATDDNGLSTTKVISVYPRKSHFTLASSPPNIGMKLDSIPVATPHTVEGVVGFQRELYPPMTAVASDGTPLQFAGWSDGRSGRHVISTPETDTTYTATYVPSAPFTASYYDNMYFSGSPVLTRQDPKIDFNWANGSPGAGVPENLFAVRWAKSQFFGGGRYRFTTVTDDGVRLYVDNIRVIDQWHGMSATAHFADVDLGTGNHTIKMEYYDGFGDAIATLSWDSPIEQPDETFHASYWNKPSGSGTFAIPGGSPVLTANEPAIDHDWGNGSPAPNISPDQFIARWTRTLSFAPGEYEFTVTGDDGVRLTVDGVTVVDKWIDQGPTPYTVQLPLDGGPHNIVMDYYENGGGALARLVYHNVGDLPESLAYQGEYWNLPLTLGTPSVPETAPDLSRADPDLDFNWFNGSPDAQLDTDRFVARWTKTDVLSAGVYRFSGVSDDGIRIFLDNVPVVDKWQPQDAPYTVDKVVLSGSHVIRVEYFESGGGARVTFSYERIGDVRPADNGYAAEYFANQDLSGAPALARQDEKVDFDWGGGSPGDAIPADHFSARWTKSVDLEAGNYLFTVTADDGVRLYVDGVLAMNKWVIQAGVPNTAIVSVGTGPHEIVLEYFESGGGALARMSYVRTEDLPPPPVTPFTAEYFDNPNLTGSPVVTRNDNAIDVDWANGSPDPAVPADFFSARWTRHQDYEAGTYRFSVTGDDGIRIFVDGNQIIDGWHDQGPTTYTADVPLDAGPHTVVVEFYERTGGALARFTEARL
jgi:glucose/arabinose dehydrogenase